MVSSFPQTGSSICEVTLWWRGKDGPSGRSPHEEDRVLGLGVGLPEPRRRVPAPADRHPGRFRGGAPARLPEHRKRSWNWKEGVGEVGRTVSK